MTTPYNTGTPSAGSALQTLSLITATPVAGFPLQNGTPVILTWTAPNDGKLHRFYVTGTQVVTIAETGGAITVAYNSPEGGARTALLFPGGSGIGEAAVWNSAQIASAVIQPGSVVSITQSGALNPGAATVWLELWGS